MPDDPVTRRVERHARGLLWYPELGYGFYPVQPDGQYGAAYWENYQKYRQSPIAYRLMRRRVELVEAFVPGEPVVDIGIGSGHFVEERGYGEASPTFGYDVNPIAVAWLKERGLWRDPYEAPVDAACLWDTLEHMEKPEDFLARVRQWIFVSIPIFDGPEHVLRSKHFKTDEHFFYFTRSGFVAWMRVRGWRLVEENRMETELGREDIGTFVFRRVP